MAVVGRGSVPLRDWRSRDWRPRLPHRETAAAAHAPRAADNPARRRELDGLRAVAVVPVMLFHFHAGLFPGGYVGVDIFFVISGYLVTALILSDMQRNIYTPGRFLMRRVRRVLPAFAAMLLVTTLAALVLLPPRSLEAFGRALVATAGQSANIQFARETGYFAVESTMRPLIHVWSLSVEAQFYCLVLLLPIVMRLAGWTAALFLVAALGVLSIVVGEFMMGMRPGFAFYLLPTRAGAFTLGMALAFILPVGTTLSGRMAGHAALLGLLLIVSALVFYGPSTPYPGVAALPPAIGAVLVIAFASPANRVGRALAHPLPVAVGVLSYGLYLWHQPVAAFFRTALGEPVGLSGLVSLCAVTLALSVASFLLVERPCARLSRWWTPRRAGAAFACFVGLAGAIGAALLTSGGLPERAGAVRAALLATATPSPLREVCHAGPNRPIPPMEACVRPVGETPGVAVFGDSHGVELAHALTEPSASGLLPAPHRGVAIHTFSACGPRARTDRSDPCARWTAETLDHLATHATIETVVVSWRILAHLSGDHRTAYPDVPTTDETPGVWQAARAVLQRLDAAGKRVILVRQVPELPQRIDVLAWRAPVDQLTSGPLQGVPRTWWEARRAIVTARLEELPDGVTVIDPSERFCDAAICHAAADGVALYFDDDHVSLSGASMTSAQILEVLRAPAASRLPDGVRLPFKADNPSEPLGSTPNDVAQASP